MPAWLQGSTEEDVTASATQDVQEPPGVSGIPGNAAPVSATGASHVLWAAEGAAAAAANPCASYQVPTGGSFAHFSSGAQQATPLWSIYTPEQGDPVTSEPSNADSAGATSTQPTGGGINHNKPPANRQASAAITSPFPGPPWAVAQRPVSSTQTEAGEAWVQYTSSDTHATSGVGVHGVLATIHTTNQLVETNVPDKTMGEAAQSSCTFPIVLASAQQQSSPGLECGLGADTPPPTRSSHPQPGPPPLLAALGGRMQRAPSSAVRRQLGQAAEPWELLHQALAGVNPDMLHHSEDPCPEYVKEDDLVLVTQSCSNVAPYNIAVSSRFGCNLVQTVVRHSDSAHLIATYHSLPRGEKQPTMVFRDKKVKMWRGHPVDNFHRARNKITTGYYAAPRSATGLPPSCDDWRVAPPLVPARQHEDDVTQLIRNLARLQKGGLRYELTDCQLSAILSLPGTAGIKLLSMVSLLLGQVVTTEAEPKYLSIECVGYEATLGNPMSPWVAGPHSVSDGPLTVTPATAVFSHIEDNEDQWWNRPGMWIDRGKSFIAGLMWIVMMIAVCWKQCPLKMAMGILLATTMFTMATASDPAASNATWSPAALPPELQSAPLPDHGLRGDRSVQQAGDRPVAQWTFNPYAEFTVHRIATPGATTRLLLGSSPVLQVN